MSFQSSEAREALTRGVQGLVIRTARAVNRALGRRGKVWADRYHARALTTPREVRHALVYVLDDMKGHQSRRTGRPDPCSSGPWFAGRRERPEPPPPVHDRPVVAAQTWLLGAGWKRHGWLDVDERPRG